eukprot:gnl/Spiro4/12857_TR6811_c0_g1_i1.p1 gnl/Spiro4/12857_TR6811_c0_g1~~gnl/Spiro4/12857_TR6811_c0_g1_i1.p1  ORF type:complete len:754 (+),score=47.31 gnl/Spiro4/12857_TR6811_c0_g1_i1:119-2380(+)
MIRSPQTGRIVLHFTMGAFVGGALLFLLLGQTCSPSPILSGVEVVPLVSLLQLRLKFSTVLSSAAFPSSLLLSLSRNQTQVRSAADILVALEAALHTQDNDESADFFARLLEHFRIHTKKGTASKTEGERRRQRAGVSHDHANALEAFVRDGVLHVDREELIAMGVSLALELAAARVWMRDAWRTQSRLTQTLVQLLKTKKIKLFRDWRQLPILIHLRRRVDMQQGRNSELRRTLKWILDSLDLLFVDPIGTVQELSLLFRSHGHVSAAGMQACDEQALTPPWCSCANAESKRGKSGLFANVSVPLGVVEWDASRQSVLSLLQASMDRASTSVPPIEQSDESLMHSHYPLGRLFETPPRPAASLLPPTLTSHIHMWDAPSTFDVEVSILVQYFQQKEALDAVLAGWWRCALLLGLEHRSELLLSLDDSLVAPESTWLQLRRWVRRTRGWLRLLTLPNVHEVRAYNMLSQLSRGRVLVFAQDDKILCASDEWISLWTQEDSPGEPEGADSRIRETARLLLNSTACPCSTHPCRHLRDTLHLFAEYPRLGVLGWNFGQFMPLVPGDWGRTHSSIGVFYSSPVSGIRFQFMAWVDVGPFVVRRTTLHDLQGFYEWNSIPGQPGIFLDWDFCTRAWHRGWQVGLLEVLPGLPDGPKPGGTHSPWMLHLRTNLFWMNTRMHVLRYPPHILREIQRWVGALNSQLLPLFPDLSFDGRPPWDANISYISRPLAYHAWLPELGCEELCSTAPPPSASNSLS